MAQSFVEHVASLMEDKGRRMYGLHDVTQLQHALQSALATEQAGCGSALIT
ncbi:MAG: hypothetical protein JO227_16560, partial [Acetobacteraceae bacterium]|nr:hypothetical protein [Acetobacteraceae bacterium]